MENRYLLFQIIMSALSAASGPVEVAEREHAVELSNGRLQLAFNLMLGTLT